MSRLVFLLALALALPAQADALICAPEQPVTLAGRAPARAGLLLSFDGRVVGGGSADATGRYLLVLTVGQERPGSYPVLVRVRDSGAVVAETTCTVPDGTAPTRMPTTAATPTASPAAPTATPTSVPPMPAVTSPTPAAGVALAAPTAAPTSTSVPTLTTVVQWRAAYDANQNRTADLDEGIGGLAVYVTDDLGQLLGQGVTDARGAVQIPLALADPQSQLTVAIPFFSVAETVPAGNPRPQPVLIPGPAQLPAVLP
ncbi:MAG TPA: hypothetical protein VFS21_30020 [Roseiflexaceae bacterium]|nr:hypothetical protein [Roseiflexaceae bacterium]